MDKIIERSKAYCKKVKEQRALMIISIYLFGLTNTLITNRKITSLLDL